MDETVSKTILLLDDDQYFRQIQSCILSAGGYNIIETPDPKHAMATSKEQHVDLFIVAYRLRGIDGVSWIEMMRACHVTTPIVFVSSSSLDSETAARLQKNLNVLAILRKPINLTTFLHEIREVVPQGTVSAASDGGPPNDLQFGVPTPENKSTKEEAHGLLMSISTELEQELRQARIEYLQYTQAELDELLNHAESTDIRNKAMFDEVQRLAHKIRGTAGTFGLTKISRLAENIEECLRQDDEPTSDLSAAVGWLLNDLRAAVRDSEGPRSPSN